MKWFSLVLYTFAVLCTVYEKHYKSRILGEIGPSHT